MVGSTLVGGYILALFVLASLPFLNDRLFGLLALRGGHKPVWLRLVEWLLLWLAGMVAGLVIEGSIGERQAQDWEFYATMLFLFAVLSLPGFVWQFQLRKSFMRRRHLPQ